MESMLLLCWRSWRKRPLRVALSLLSVSIAVAAVLATGMAADSARHAYENLSDAVEGPPALDIVSAEGGKLKLAEAPDLSGVADIQEILPMSTRATYLKNDVAKFSSLMLGLPLGAGKNYVKLASGALPEFEDQIVLSNSLAHAAGAKVGDWISLATLRGYVDCEVSGIAEGESLALLAPGASSIVPLSQIQKGFLQRDKVDRIRLYILSRDHRDALVNSLTQRLPSTLLVQAPEARVKVADEMLKGAELALRFASTLAVAMSVFVVLNVLRTSFHERRRQFAMLRCVGATRNQVSLLMLGEGLVFGLLGIALGVPLGIRGAKRVAAALAAVLKAPPPDIEIAWGHIVVAALVGLLASLFAAYLPSRHFRSLTPLEALSTHSDARKEKLPWSVIFWGLAAWVGAFTIMAGVIRQKLPPSMATPAGVLMLMAFLVATPLLLEPLLRLVGWMSSPFFRLEGQLATQQLLRKRTRTTLTVSVLVIAAANAIGLGHSILNNVSDVRSWYSRSMVGDIFLVRERESETTTASPVAPQELAERVAALPDVKHVITARIINARINDAAASLIVRDFPASVPLHFRVDGPKTAEQVRSCLGAGQVVMSTVLAKRLKLTVGDEVLIDAAGTNRKAKICALASDYTLGGLTCFLDAGAVGKEFAATPFDIVMAGLKGAPRPETLKEFQTLAEKQGYSLQSLEDMKARLERVLQGILAALWTLLVLGFVVGGFGVANALLVSVTEQTRELGLLRLAGMTRGQSARLVAAEAWSLGVAGGFLGVSSGVVSAWLMHLVNVPLLGHRVDFVLRYNVVWLSLAGLLAVSLAAAWAPGRRAAQLNVLNAISVE